MLDAPGRVVLAQAVPAGAATLELVLPQPVPGPYRVRLRTSQGSSQQRLLVP